jgi:hypothetical protein
MEYLVFDRKSGEKKMDEGIRDTTSAIRPGNPVVPLGLKLPIENLAPGSYRVELRAMDSVGNKAAPRTVDFEVQ